MLTTCLFDSWYYKPKDKYIGNGLLEQVDVLPIKVGDKTYYMHYKDWKAIRDFYKSRGG